MNITKTSTLAAVVFSLSLAACGDGSPANTEADTSTTVESAADADATTSGVPVDFLWVVDGSSSMCQEQNALGEAFAAFTRRLERQVDVDPRVAVVSHDVQCDRDEVTVFAAKGVFNTTPALEFPPPCQERRVRDCFADAACANMDCVVRGECPVGDPECTCEGDLGEWTCRHPNTEQCVENPNGTLNSQCVRHCTEDADCRALFDDERYVCQKPSANQQDWGCIRPPLTADCPESLPSVLDASNLDLFRCLATVGVNQEKCFKYEQGMSASLMALEPDGPNPEQGPAFLRDDAWLVVLYVTDEDDCSVAGDGVIDEDHYDTCALLPTTDDGGPLLPVSTVAERLKALKADPTKVIVTAIAGDSTAGTSEQVQRERDAYLAAKADPKTCFHQSYICLSSQGTAEFGARYLALTEAFGANGAFVNICDDSGLGPALDAIADTVATTLRSRAR
ncbi:MAG: hypothetical protein EP329_16180 [Deltaproteobacteria bacterium]|nr:MAG: hypothetical protein EP329_16180 [Deltaproteobacteria bacterium]